jgi:hypothetical protein
VDSSIRYPQLYIGEACSAFFFGVIIGKLTFSGHWASFVISGVLLCTGLALTGLALTGWSAKQFSALSVSENPVIRARARDARLAASL